MTSEEEYQQRISDGLSHLGKGVNAVVKNIGLQIKELDPAKQQEIAASLMGLIVSATEAAMIIEGKKNE